MVAASTTAALAIGYLLYSFSTTKKKRKKGKKSAKSKEVTQERLVAIFSELALHMDRAVMATKKRVFATLEQLAQQGTQVPEDEIYMLMQRQVKEQMAVAEARTYAKYQTSESAVKAACETYKEDPKFIELKERLQMVFGSCQNPKNKAPVKGFTEEKCLEVIAEMTEMLREIFATAVKELEESNPNIKKPIPGAVISPRIALKQQQAIITLSQKYGFKPQQFDSVITTYNGKPAVKEALQKMMLLPMEFGIGGM